MDGAKVDEAAPDDPLIIVQHPKVPPSNSHLASRRIKLVHLPIGLRTHVNTEEGSSGSPVSASDWSPIALHHWGGTGHNRGVCFDAVLADLAARGIALGQ